MEKIVIQNLRYAWKLVGVDVLVTENVIHVGAVAAQLTGKPRSSALLSFKFFVYGVSYVHKKRELFRFPLIIIVGLDSFVH